MLFYFSKIVQGVLWPFNLALVCFALSAWHLRHRRARWIPIAGFGLLWFFGSPAVAMRMMGWLESDSPAIPVADYPTADAIVVLGGSVFPFLPPRIEPEEMNGLRVYTGARLFRAKKAPVVVVSGGGSYVGRDGQLRGDADDMRQVLGDQGVPSAAVRIESRSRTTYENAVETARLLGTGKKILLVTSAFHLRRASALYRRAGFEVIPVPGGHLSTLGSMALIDVFPDALSLETSTRALKELVGYAAYSVLAPFLH